MRNGEITATMVEVATEAAKQFTTSKRDNGDSYTHTVADAPEWIKDMCQEAHAGMFPDDFKYEMLRDAVRTIAEADEGCDSGELQGEFADSAVAIYNNELTAWLASHSHRAQYVEDAQREFGGMSRSGEFDLFALISQGWYMEASEVFGYVLGAVEVEAENNARDN